MEAPWTAEHLIEESVAKQLIESQFPQLAPATVLFCGEGYDNVVYRVNSSFLFRFPRRQFGADCIPAETSLLPFLAKHLPLPIPNPIFFGKPTADYPWRFLGYQYLEGQEGCSARLTMTERAALAVPLAQFLKALHATPISEVQPLGIQYDRIRKLDIAHRWPQAEEHLMHIEVLGLFNDCEALFGLLKRLKNIRNDGNQTVVHGDLYARHLLISKERTLAGIIDWGDLQVDNVASDLSIVFTFLPLEAHQVFFEVYGQVSPEIIQLMLFNALRHTTAITVYAEQVEDADLLTEMLVALELITQAAKRYLR